MKKEKSQQKNMRGSGLILGALIIIIIFAVSNNGGKDDGGMSIDEAHGKCVAMEMADLWLYNPDHSNLYERANESCFLSRGSSDKEKEFIEVIEVDWEAHKDDVVDGITIQELYEKIKQR